MVKYAQRIAYVLDVKTSMLLITIQQLEKHCNKPAQAKEANNQNVIVRKAIV